MTAQNQNQRDKDKDREREYEDRQGHVPISVIDKILTLNQENNSAYSEIVGVLNTLTDRMVGVCTTLSKLHDQIESENLAEAVKLCTENIQSQVDTMALLMESIKGSACTYKESVLAKSLEDYLKYNGISEQMFSKLVCEHFRSPVSLGENTEIWNWFIKLLSGLKEHWGKLMLIFGLTMGMIYFNGGKNILEALQVLP